MTQKITTALFMLILLPALAFAENYDRVRKDLKMNRQMIARFQSEQAELLAVSGSSLSAAESKKLDDLQYKIKGLKSDASELLAMLPPEEQAGEYLSFLMTDEATKPKKDLATFELSQKTRPFHEKALELVADQKYSEAAQTYEDIVLQDPSDDQAYLLMGHCYLITGDYEKAENAFQNSVHIDPDNFHTIAPFYENSVLQNPDDENYANLGYAYMVLSDFTKAKKAFWDALQINPANKKAMNGMRLLEAHNL